MNRLERITAILLMLQSRKKVTAQQLADHFETSIRTIYRDVRVLEEAGVPVGAEAGLGYYLMDGYTLPPVMLNKEEAAAMLMGEKLLDKFGDVSMNREIKNAMQKIRAVLRSSDKDFLEKLEENMAVFHYKRHKMVDDSFPDHFISSIQHAIVKQQVIEIEYYSLHSDETSKRAVESIGLTHIRGSWHLFAWCRLRKSIRDFRSDRIKSLRILDEYYNRSKHPSLQEIAESFYNPKDLTRIIIKLDNSIPKSATDMKYYLGVVEENKKKDHTEMIFLHYSLNEFAKWLVFWGDKVTIVEPKELMQEMKKLSMELHKHYL